MQELQVGTLLQNGKYKIVKPLGKGGFGITYLAKQTVEVGGALGKINSEVEVTIKEFFMNELCNRDKDTTTVSVPSEGSQAIVERFRRKFLKEARNISRLQHPNIVKVFEIFEENGTAYYVMEYISGGSLAEKVRNQGSLPEADATRYITKIGNALGYIHQKKMNHLDVKPANIMLTDKDEPILIDFGLSKQYDASTGKQTSTTPPGISEGYAPLEQYKHGGVSEFSPETDIYALGATFFKLLTGATPPSASDINEEGLPIDKLKAKGVSQDAINTIRKAMQSRKKERFATVDQFFDCLSGTTNTIEFDDDDDTTTLALVNEVSDEEFKNVTDVVTLQPVNKGKSKKKIIIITIAAIIVAIIGACVAMYVIDENGKKPVKLYFKAKEYESSLQTEQAIEYYKQSAELGYDDSQIILGEYYFNGTRVNKDYKEALKWFHMAVDQENDMRGQYYIALCYLEGKGVEKDEAKAVEWMQKSADQGRREAEYYMGYFYQNGIGVMEDQQKAIEYYKLAATEGDTDAQEALTNLGVSQ